MSDKSIGVINSTSKTLRPWIWGPLILLATAASYVLGSLLIAAFVGMLCGAFFGNYYGRWVTTRAWIRHIEIQTRDIQNISSTVRGMTNSLGEW